MLSPSRRPVRGDGLLAPSALVALVLWLANDHVLKALTPSALTGKLSDVASLIVLPLALQAGWELSSTREPFTPSRTSIVAACLMVGGFFVFMEATQLGSLVFRSILAFAQWPLALLRAREWVAPRLVTHKADLEDLLTLPALLLPYQVGRRRWLRACVLHHVEHGGDAHSQTATDDAGRRDTHGARDAA